MELRWRKSTAVANISSHTFQKWHSCLSSLPQHGLSFLSLEQPLSLPFPQDRGSDLGPHPLSDQYIQFMESVNLDRKTIFIFTDFKLKCCILFNYQCRQQSIGNISGTPDCHTEITDAFLSGYSVTKYHLFQNIIYIHPYFKVMVVTRPTAKSYYLML